MTRVQGIKARIGVAHGGRRAHGRARDRAGRSGQDSARPRSRCRFDRISTFTPASADPRLAGAFAGRGARDRRFQIHPRRRQGPPVAAPRRGPRARLRRRRAARSMSPPLRSTSALTPGAAISLGVAVGWKRFARRRRRRQGRRSPDPAIGSRESAVVGVSYNLKKFTGRVAVGGGTQRRPHRRAVAARQCLGRCRRRLQPQPPHRGDRRRALPRRAGPRSPRWPTSAATARPSTSAPPSNSSSGQRDQSYKMVAHLETLVNLGP